MKELRKLFQFTVLVCIFFTAFNFLIPWAMEKEQQDRIRSLQNPIALETMENRAAAGQNTVEVAGQAAEQNIVEMARQAAESPQTENPQENIPHIKLNVKTPTEARTEPKTTIKREEKTEYSTKSLGTFRITAYCSCKICCGKWSEYNKTYSGTTPQAGRTIAVYENQIPIGSKVMIDGHIYTAEDTGSAIHENCIDIYYDSHKDALRFGVQKKEVFLITDIKE